jgi:hypothetical protein
LTVGGRTLDYLTVKHFSADMFYVIAPE